MEYAAGGELYDHLSSRKGVENEEARMFFSQIVSAIQYCHEVSLFRTEGTKSCVLRLRSLLLWFL